MKKLLKFAFIFSIALALSYGTVFAGNASGDIKLSGKHWQFNLIGHPKGINGDDSNGRAIMVPIGRKKVNKNSEFTCTLDGDIQFDYTEDVWPNFTDSFVLKGVKLVFQKTSELDFDIIDRDATDGEATILVPETTGQDVVDGVDVYIRILGNPHACMTIDGVAVDGVQGLWWYSGHVTLNRKPGKSVFEPINDLFDVLYCDTWVDSVIGSECAVEPQEISVFSNVFSEYFWDIDNYGTKIVQVRLYPRSYQPVE